MQKTDCFELGYITKPKGIAGELHAVFDVDDPSYYAKLEAVFLELNGQIVPYLIENIRLNGANAVLKLEDIDSVEAAEELQSTTLWLPLKALPKLSKGQFYYHDIIGYQVVDKQLGQLGTVASVVQLAHQDLITMTYMHAEVLIPITDGIVLHADAQAKELHTHLPEGLLEVYLENNHTPDDAD